MGLFVVVITSALHNRPIVVEETSPSLVYNLPRDVILSFIDQFHHSLLIIDESLQSLEFLLVGIEGPNIPDVDV